jgi:hypothetical protein
VDKEALVLVIDTETLVLSLTAELDDTVGRELLDNEVRIKLDEVADSTIDVEDKFELGDDKEVEDNG